MRSSIFYQRVIEMNMVDSLPKQKKQVKAEIEKLFSRYRIWKRVSSFKRKEASITASYTPRYHGNTNTTSDQTADVAISNVDEQAKRQAYCEWIEAAVSELEDDEQLLIRERYMIGGNKMHDYIVYTTKFDPPISHVTYDEIRWSAFIKLSLMLDIGKEA